MNPIQPHAPPRPGGDTSQKRNFCKGKTMTVKAKQMIFVGIIVFVIIFSSIWYGMSNSLCSMIADDKTDKAIAMIDKMSTTHINSYTAPLFMRPLYGMIESE
jgi:hypothetical protein